MDKTIFVKEEVYNMVTQAAQEKGMTVQYFVEQLIEGNSERQEQEPIETVDRSVTIKVAKEFDDFLQILAKATNTTPEKFFAEELYHILMDFREGGHWDEFLEPIGKRLEKTARQVWQEL